MTIDPQCYVCGKEELCINGLCHDCTMQEFFVPGAAFAATFGAIDSMAESGKPDSVDPAEGEQIHDDQS